jgi:hypothetical protein
MFHEYFACLPRVRPTQRWQKLFGFSVKIRIYRIVSPPSLDLVVEQNFFALNLRLPIFLNLNQSSVCERVRKVVWEKKEFPFNINSIFILTRTHFISMPYANVTQLFRRIYEMKYKSIDSRSIHEDEKEEHTHTQRNEKVLGHLRVRYYVRTLTRIIDIFNWNLCWLTIWISKIDLTPIQVRGRCIRICLARGMALRE